MSGGDCSQAYSRRQEKPENLLCAREGRAFSRDNELCGLNSYCSRQSTENEGKGNKSRENESKGNKSRENESKGKISLEIIDGINNEVIKNVYINLEVPELGLKATHFMGRSL